ncbi:MAG: tail fiber domain-containing protein, partial [Phycisphaerales bacterium]|nr:tail fiber domain-containing protein [Phycisphaerales bacterium]
MKPKLSRTLMAGVVGLCVGAADAQWMISPFGVFVQGTNLGVGTSAPNWDIDLRTSDPRGIFVAANRPFGVTSGVWSQNRSTSGRGVFGLASARTGITHGLYGKTYSSRGRGVYGEAMPRTGFTYGVFGKTYSNQGRGVMGYAPAFTGGTFGVYGLARSGHGVGVYGKNNSGTGVKGESSVNVGVYGLTSTGSAVFGQATNPTGYAGFFMGGMNYFQNNVGIGTMMPTTNLHVVGGAAVTGNSVFGGDDGAFWPVTVQTSDNGYGMVHGSTQSDSSVGTFVDADSGSIGTLSPVRLDLFTNHVPRLSIDANGRVATGIGTETGKSFRIRQTNGDTYPFWVEKANGAWIFAVDSAGNAYSSLGGTLTSDARLKTDITPLVDSMDKISALRGVRFEWRENHSAHGAGTQIGLIAQDVEKVLPELVSEGPDGYKGVRYQNLVAVLVEAVKAQQEQIDAQQRQID